MERRSAHGRSTHEHRRECGDRRERSHAAHVDQDVLDRGRGLLRRELECDGPAWIARDVPQLLLIRDPVDLYDHAVRAVLEVVSPLLPLGDEPDDLIERGGLAPVRIDAKAERFQPREELALRADIESRRAVGPHREVSSRGGLRIELAHGAGGRVPRIRERRLAALQAFLVGRLERALRQVDLAADVGSTFHRLAERERNRPNRAEIRADVLADQSVAARRALDEFAVLVRQVDREPVDLQLAHVADVVAAEELADPLIEGP